MFNNNTGVYNLPVISLKEPPPFRRVHEVKKWYVDYLAGMFLEDKGDHENLTPPLLVIASVGKLDFQERCIERYTYDVSVLEMLINFDNKSILGNWWNTKIFSNQENQ